jgi:hypothetical protein
VAVIDELGEGGVGVGGVTGGEEGDGGEEVFVGWIGEEVDVGGEAVGGGGDAEMKQRAAAADGEFAVVGIVDGEGAGAVGVEVDDAVIDTEAPGLGVVAGRGAHGGLEDGHDGVVEIYWEVHL